MGKKGKGKQGGFTHVPTHNPAARESGERRMQILRNLEVKRLESRVEKQKQAMRRYLTPEVVARKKQKVDPHYDLKGPARPARDFYLPPEEEVEPEDLLVTYDGKMWEHEEGQRLLIALLEYGAALHNVGNRSRDAVNTFKSMQKLDPDDHLLARHRQLACHLDNAEADRARQLLDAFPGDKSALFCYSRALIEFLSLQLKESGTSEKSRDDLLMSAYDSNPYAAFALANHGVFEQVVEHAGGLMDDMAPPGSVEDALRYFTQNLPLWQEIEGALDWVRDKVKDLPPPLAEVKLGEEEEDEEGEESDGEGEGRGGEGEGNGVQDDYEEEEDEEDEEEEEEEEEGRAAGGKNDEAVKLDQLSPVELHAMFADMFNTALEMVTEKD